MTLSNNLLRFGNWLAPLAVLATGLILYIAIRPLTTGQALLNWPGLAIVVVGTVTVTLSTMVASDVQALWAGARALLRLPTLAVTDEVKKLVKIADFCRRSNVHQIEKKLDQWDDFPALHHGITMLLDGKQPSDVLHAADQFRASDDRWWHLAIGVVRRASETAPAMGLLGTLIGLVGMLGQLSNPAEIGPAMALALLTTFYGAFLAYCVLSPLADRLDRYRRLNRERANLEVTTLNSILKNENSQHLRTALIAVLQPNERKAVK